MDLFEIGERAENVGRLAGEISILVAWGTVQSL